MRVLIVIAACFVLSIQFMAGQETGCIWPSTPGCPDPWIPKIEKFNITYSATPPCIFEVTVYFQTRCNQVEVAEWSAAPLTATPPGCASTQQIYAFMSTITFKNALFNAVAARIGRDKAISGDLLPCPNYTPITTSKFATCMRPVIVYQFPSGSTIQVDYDPLNSWEYYNSLYMESGGVFTEIRYVSCVGTVCCFRDMSFCLNADGTVNYTVGAWRKYGVCPPFGPCTLTTCD